MAKKYLDDTGVSYFWGKIKTYVNNAVKVTGVKGNSESIYRTGNVNITAAHVGATSTSVLPNDGGEIKTKYRISNKGNTGSASTSWYFPLVKLPQDNSGNYASLIISGRIGGWVDSNMSSIQALVWNRGSTGIALMDIAGSATAMSSIWNICDIVVYTNSDTTDTVYLLAKSYFTFDLDIELYQSTATILYDATYSTTTPSGTLSAQASTSTRRVEIVNGKFLVGGTDLSVVSNLTGTLGVGHGGTGQTSAINAANAFMNALSTGSSTPTDADYYISQYVGGGTATTTYHRRPMSALWEYIKGKIRDVFYPVGSYYETSDTTFNPNVTWGGTWSLEAEGLVHIGAGTTYTVGATGGEASHTLTINEMPAHTHDFQNVMGYVYSTAGGNGTYGAVNTWSGTKSTGGGQAHNNMQPYVVVNRWHRTA